MRMVSISDVEIAFKNFLATNNHPMDKTILFDTDSFNRYSCPHASSYSNLDVSYIAFSGEFPGGYFKCWHCGIEADFSFINQREASNEEWKKHIDRIKQKKHLHNEQVKKAQAEACNTAQQLLNTAQACSTHPYLESKNVKSYGLYVTDDNTLLIPCHDIHGRLVNLERIYKNSETGKFDKRPLKNGQRNGVFFQIGEVINPRGIICISEGYSTAATVYEALNLPTFVSFNCGNLPHTVQAICQQYPDAKILITADRDTSEAGEKFAKKAIELVKGAYVLPDFSIIPDNLNPEIPRSDFNDLHELLMANGLNRDAALSEIQRQIITNQINHTASMADQTQIENNQHINTLTSPLVAVTLSSLLKMELPPRENFLDPWLPKSGLCMVYAKRGVGKTFFALELAMAIAYGTSFLSFNASKPTRVLYIDGEMPANSMQERLATIEQRMPANLNMIEPVFITPDLQDGLMPNISTPEGQKLLEKYTDQADLVIVDNISTLCGFGKENEAESWLPLQQWALNLRRQGKSVLFVHHAGKNGNQRGTSKREDILDTVILLKHPTDYEPSIGVCFELHFEKARGMMGDDVNPIICQLTEEGWTFRSFEESTYKRVVELFNEGLKQADIAKELEISKGQVSKHVKKAKELGEIK